jgi:hypothetical protein
VEKINEAMAERIEWWMELTPMKRLDFILWTAGKLYES